MVCRAYGTEAHHERPEEVARQAGAADAGSQAHAKAMAELTRRRIIAGLKAADAEAEAAAAIIAVE